MDPRLRIAFSVAGILSLAVGIGLLRAKATTRENVERYLEKN
jgi:hypothetical protein